MPLRYIDGAVFKKTLIVQILSIIAGIVLIIMYINLDNYFKSQEFPDLAKDESLTSDIIYSVKREGAILYVEFGSGKRRKIVNGSNFNYEQGSQSMREVLSTDDFVSKSAGSDTIHIKHKLRDFFFVPSYQIRKGSEPF